MKKRKRASTVVVISTKHGLWDKNMVGSDEEGRVLVEDVYVIFLFLYFLEKNFL